MKHSFFHSFTFAACLIYSFLLSFCLILSKNIVFSGNLSASAEENYMNDLTLKDFTLFLFLSAVILLMILILHFHRFSFKSPSVQITLFHSKYCQLWIALLILLAWLPILLADSPGTVYSDPLSSMNQVLGDTVHLNNQQPVAYTLFLGFLMKTGKKLWGSYQAGVYLNTALQTSCLIFTMVCILNKLIKNHVNDWLVLLSLLFFMFYPLFPVYALTMMKDTIFSCALVWLSLLLVDAGLNQQCLRSRKWLLYYCITCIILLFFRNNGIYIIAFTTLFMLIRKCISKKQLLLTVILLFSYSRITTFAYNRYQIHTYQSESFGIPLQQTAALLSDDSNQIESDDLVYLETILPINEWQKNYSPCLADTIKWSPDFNHAVFDTTYRQFLSVWMKYLPAHLNMYLKAYGMETFGYWIPVHDENFTISTFIESNDYGLHSIDLIQDITGLDLQSRLFKTHFYMSGGTAFWLMMTAWLNNVLHNRNKKNMLAFIPFIANWLTLMIAVPIATGSRYIFGNVIALPLLFFLPFLIQSRNS